MGYCSKYIQLLDIIDEDICKTTVLFTLFLLFLRKRNFRIRI